MSRAVQAMVKRGYCTVGCTRRLRFSWRVAMIVVAALVVAVAAGCADKSKLS
jgi:hypothetical protein